MTVKPIIVVGMNRSGTRWLTTLLSCHPDISAIRAITNDNPGALAQETNMFGIFPRLFKNISNKNKYVAIVELWSKTLFFSYLDVTKFDLYNLNPRPTNCYSLFKMAMDLHSVRSGTRFWIQKTTPSSFKQFNDYFEDAFFIVIKRHILANIRSKVKRLHHVSDHYSIAKLVFLYVTDSWVLDKYLLPNTDNVCMVSYEDLKDNTSDELKRIYEFVSIENHDAIKRESLYRNTRFANQEERDRVLSKNEEMLIILFKALFQSVPGSVLWRIRDQYSRAGCSKFINSTFTNIVSKYKL